MTSDFVRDATFARMLDPRPITGGKLSGQKPGAQNERNLVDPSSARTEKARAWPRDPQQAARLRPGATESGRRGAGGEVKARAIIKQKTKRPAQFEITEHTRTRRHAGPQARTARGGLYFSRAGLRPRLISQYVRNAQRPGWVSSTGLNPATYGTHSLRRTARRPYRIRIGLDRLGNDLVAIW